MKSAKYIAGAALLILECLAVTANAGTITVTDSPLGRSTFGGNDVVDWTTLGPQFTPLSSSFHTTSLGNIGLTVSQPSGSLERRTQPISWNGNFTDGNELIWTGGDNAHPLSFTFDSLVQGVGFQINPNYGETSTHVEVFGSNNVLFGAFDLATNDRNTTSADFIGFTSSLGDIARITVSQGLHSDFAVNQLSIIATGSPTNDVPEPASLAILGLGLAGMTAARRSRK